MLGGNGSNITIAAVLIAIVLLVWFLKPSKKAKTEQEPEPEKYNAGNNIDFRKTRTDKNLPADVMPHTDVPNVGSPFIIIDNP